MKSLESRMATKTTVLPNGCWQWTGFIDKNGYAAADFKLNDHYHSRYARLILATHPEFDGFFEIRELKAE